MSPTLSNAALFTLVYATAPILHPVGARLSAIGGRSLGGLLTFLYFLCFGAARVFELPLWYGACVPLGVATLLSSQFGLQVLALFSLGLSLYFLSFVPASVFLASVAAGLAVPGLGLRRQLEAKLAHYRWYMTRFPGRGIDDRNNLAMLVKLPLYLVQEPNKAVTYLFYKLTPFILLYSVPVILVMGIELWSEPGTWGSFAWGSPRPSGPMRPDICGTGSKKGSRAPWAGWRGESTGGRIRANCFPGPGRCCRPPSAT